MLTIKNINPNLINSQYAVRGKIVSRAQELEAQGRKIIYCNIGNPQALKQKPITFVRQILSLVEYPPLLENSEIRRLFPQDVIDRVKLILKKNPPGTGAYTQSAGIPFIRKAVAEFIEKRDSIPSDPDKIILTDGASKGVQAVLTMIIKSSLDGVMIPIPQYPLYSATITLLGGAQIGYYLDETNHWQLNENILIESISKAKDKGINPVAIVVINPGNPTGAVLSSNNIQMIINFAKKHNLAILADEVYQENVYSDELKFYSFAKVMYDMNETETTLFSFHSVSKGFFGECGHRGGYLEVRNIGADAFEQLIKLQSISLCANVDGQIVTYAMVSPPQQGDESYETYIFEKQSILRDLKEKAEILGAGLNRIEGISVDIPRGAMYAFVKLDLPYEKGVNPDTMSEEELLKYNAQQDFNYCLSLLEETGICVVPGSGFGQQPGTLHFRTTFLPPKDEIGKLVVLIRDFHTRYIKRLYSN
ncbi:MAG: aminotransferase class I/II-fold pyridoxal phosphate-dependent enzyme [Ignavibacteria bacterium]